MFASARANGRPGLGSSETISACASRSRFSSAPVTAMSFFRSRRASSGRWLLQTMIAIACASPRGRVRSCSVRHSARSRAPTPVGSMLCRKRRPQRSWVRIGSAGSSSSSSLGVVGLERQAAFAQPGGDVLQRIGEIALVVERIDQHQHRRRIGIAEAHARQLAAQVVLQAGDRRVAIGVVDVAVVLGAGLAGRLADAVEVLALGAVLPVVALGAAEIGRAVDRRHVVAAAVAAALRRPLGLALAGVLGARQPLRERLERRRAPLPRPRGRGSARASARLPGAARASRAAAAGSTAAAAASARGAARGEPAGTVSSPALTSGSSRRDRPCGRRRWRRSRPACLRRAPGPR